MNLAILTKAIWVAMAFMLSTSVHTKSLFGQDIRKDTSGLAISSSDSSVTVEITVRYLPGRTTLEGLTTKIQDTNADDAVLVVRSEVIQAPNSSGVAKDQQSPFGSIFPELSLECLRHDEAHALCEKHFKDELPEGIRLENFYTVKVDFQTVAHVDNDYDWLSLACLVDEKGKLIKPITWLQLPSVSESPLEDAVSGLLIFPKIPVMKLGLTLHLLRANGEGYDSYTVEVPKN